MKTSRPYLFVIVILTLGMIVSCQKTSDDNRKIAVFNSYLTPGKAALIDKFSEQLDAWFYNYSKGVDYNGKLMKEILIYLSSYNNVGRFIQDDLDCNTHFSIAEKDLMIEIFSDTYSKSEDGMPYRELLVQNNELGQALFNYAVEEQDTLIKNFCSNEFDVINVPALICGDYGALTAEQLESPIIKRMLFIELLLPVLVYHCYPELVKE